MQKKMSYKQEYAPYYKEINELLAAIPMNNRTSNPDFFCLRLESDGDTVYLPPFRRGFYFIALLQNAMETKIESTEARAVNTNNILVFQPPGLVYSFKRHSATTGYLLYFKPQCFSFFRPKIEDEFPFFENLYTDILELTLADYLELSLHFEEVFSAYEKVNDTQHRIAALKLLALLYELRNFAAFNQSEKPIVSSRQALFKNFLRSINTYYLEKRTVDQYAQLLAVSANYLSRIVKLTSGKNALDHINARLISEAKSLILFTDFDIAEITFRLNFSDPANFSKYFKKHTGFTPTHFRYEYTE